MKESSTPRNQVARSDDNVVFLPVGPPPCTGRCDDCTKNAAIPKAVEAVVAIDSSGCYELALSLIGRLGLPDVHLTLIHTPESDLSHPACPNIQDEDVLRVAATSSVSKAMSCVALLMEGNAADRLIRMATKVDADLVAVGTGPQQSPPAYTARIAEALALSCRTSVLITRSGMRLRDRVRVVFATDHSPFSQACLDRFFELSPRGINEVIVTTAWELDDHHAESLGQSLEKLGGDAERWIEETLTDHNLAACARLEREGFVATSVVRRGHVNDVLDAVMTESASDLLVVGSHGARGAAVTPFGSTSFHQATCGQQSVLVLRPREA